MLVIGSATPPAAVRSRQGTRSCCPVPTCCHLRRPGCHSPAAALLRSRTGVGAQPFGCDEAAVGSLATVTAAGARSRHEFKGSSAVHDEGSRGELVSVRAGLGPARGRDAVALCRRHGRVAPGAVRSTRRAEDVLGLCDRDGVDAPPGLPGALAPSGRLLAVGLVVDGCRSRSPRPHHALPTQSVSRGCIPPHPIARTHPSHRRQHGTVDCGRRVCTAPGSLDTHLCYAAWRSSYSSRASIGV